MKYPGKKYHDQNEIDESLFGLLNAYKGFNTYIKLMVNDQKRRVMFMISDNPSAWSRISETEIAGYTTVKRLKLQPRRMFVKFIGPEHIINYMGPTIGMKLPLKNVIIHDFLDDSQKRYFSIEVPQKHMLSMMNTFKKLIDLTPQRKYEIIENFYSIRS
ncbi:MAG: hypothetical protein JW982_00110 [Spirochaetes bacterium]|nr:hypothetical protein [Spirochaetota bacterium]